MINLLSLLFPALGAPVAGLGPVRPRVVHLLLGVATANAVAAVVLAFGTPAGEVHSLAGGDVSLIGGDRLLGPAQHFDQQHRDDREHDGPDHGRHLDRPVEQQHERGHDRDRGVDRHRGDL